MKAFARRENALITKANGKFIFAPGSPVTHSRFFAAGAALLREDADVTKRSESGVIKGGGTREICHREREMMQHEFYVRRLTKAPRFDRAPVALGQVIEL